MGPAQAQRRRILYGRRQGRKLRPGQRAVLEEYLPRLRLPLPPPGSALDLARLFPSPKRDFWIEVGFGGGEHLAWQAEQHPDIGFLGCEPFVNGMATLLGRVKDLGLENVRVLDDDARALLETLPENAVGRVFVLFPDPWPKRRHHKRRIIQRATLDRLAFALKDGAELRLASDDPGYVRWMLWHALTHPDFDWLAETAGDWRQRPPDWPETRYESKARRQGHTCYFLRFKRRPRGSGRHETS
ncbi:MAG: tRNA (guanosine(46)-N7)-methyltransferase TrmB [Alphaproteobacteria bacterium]